MNAARQPTHRRAVILAIVLIIAAVAILGFSVTLLLSALRAGERELATAILPGAILREYATLPDDDAYPAALASAADGTLFTGSFASGALWRIDTRGRTYEIPGTRAALYSVSGLTVAADGTLYIVDGAIGAGQGSAEPAIYTLSPAGELLRFAGLPDLQLPDDIALDAGGNVYVSDWGANVVWRFTPAGVGEIWWRPPLDADIPNPDPIGLAYDASRDAMLISEPIGGRIYRVLIASDDPRADTETLYAHGEMPQAPGFDGLTVTASGEIYLAALGQNQLLRLRAGQLEVIAAGFRGISDVAHSDGRLYATNWDQVSIVSQLVPARTPFAIDEIALPAGN